jgi:spore coat protein H
MLRPSLLAFALSALAASCAPAPLDGDEGEGEGEGEAGEGEGEGEPGPLPCEPVLDGTTSVLEGDVLDVVVRCATGKVVDFEAPSIPVPPAGLTLDDDNHVRWPTDLNDATVFDFDVRDPETRETVRLHIAVADALGVEGNEPIVDPLAYTEEFGLPVVRLSAQPDAEVYVDTEIVADGHVYVAEAKLRGATSLGYPTHSFTLKFDGDDRFNLPARAGQLSADSFVEKKKVVLTTTFDDSSYLRQRLAFQLWNRTCKHEHVRIQSTSVVVYVGSSYLGLYTMTDHVDRDLFEESLGLNDDGQLYKSTSHDANFRNVDFPEAGFERRDEPDVDLIEPFSDLAELVRAANVVDENGGFEAAVSPLIDRDDIVEWWVFATAILAEDSYGKNAYLYRPGTTTDGSTPRFRFAPWDFNAALGQAWETSRTSTDVAADEGWPLDTNLLWQRELEGTASGFEARRFYGDVIRHALSEEEVLALFDAMVVETQQAAQRNASVWADDYAGYFGRTDAAWADEVAFMRLWIAQRWAYLRTAFPAVPQD